MRVPLQSWPQALTLIVCVTSLAGCEESDAPDDVVRPVRAADVARVVSAADALAGAHIPTLDPVTMKHAEIRLVLDGRPMCVFRYVSGGKPVLVLREAEDENGTLHGVVKLNGSLVTLTGQRGGEGLVLADGEVRATVTPVEPEDDLVHAASRIEANLLFEVDRQLEVGYRGYYRCAEASRVGTDS